MFDLCSDRLLECEDRFSDRNGHRFVETWDCGDDGTPMYYRSGELKGKEIAGWVNEYEVQGRSGNGPVRSMLRVLLCPKPAGKPSSGKLPFSRSTYDSLAKAWRVPSTFLRAVTQKLSIVTQCAVAPNSPPRWHQAGTYDILHNERGTSMISDQSRSLLVRGDVDWTWDYTLLLTFDPTTRTTYVLIVGLTATEIDLVHSYISSAALNSPPTLSTHPMLIPTILLDLATDDTSSLLKVRINLLAQIQQQTGMDRYNSLKSAAVSGRTTSIGGREKDRQELDLDAVMLKLTCLSDWVAAQRGFVGIQGRIVQVVGEMLAADDGIPETRSAHDDDDDDESQARRIVHMFRERLSFVKESLVAAEHKCQYLERSINAQVQTVPANGNNWKIYSLIGQKDNRLNILAANSSCQIASDSRRIAILTRRDSTDMRIIAAVTLIFLPGTFVATVFSTGMFDWGGDSQSPGPDSEGAGGGNNKIVSSYIWVYFMLTGVLTFFVLVAWVLFSWVQNRKMMKQFGFDPEQGGGLDIGSEKRQDTDTTLVDGRRAGRRARVWGEFERWREQAGGSLRWWRTTKKEEEEEFHRVAMELKSA
ncbi:hypothetical protein K504DRAFT_455079 [Pleomassaria siparia CBS 279.74]|uniref:Uncharacterized protein n=1 Tax=Pleomassaria siparia CBS 279.74 TaxID=1314801 RepID=A0A6G1K8X2_9PLEO|nr:hypothetical protein K504DRAFT_455079 [Pleomassaria siparia CBS 279.74]